MRSHMLMTEMTNHCLRCWQTAGKEPAHIPRGPHGEVGQTGRKLLGSFTHCGGSRVAQTAVGAPGGVQNEGMYHFVGL